MRLAAFIRGNIEQISAEWEKFAATLLPAKEYSSSVLRDGIVEMLIEIANNMDSAQSAKQQQGKSEGVPRPNRHIEDAAETHALARVKMGLSSRQLIAEFRALRATVIRLWQDSPIDIDKSSLYDLTRFNESIDQALSEAAERYTQEIERSRELFLGMLGHDLRNPLAAISGLAELQLQAKTSERYINFARRISISAARMNHLITDLMELTRVRLGSGITIKRTRSSLRAICVDAIHEIQAIYPERMFNLDCNGGLFGDWDKSRMAEVLSNLLGNAVQHGAPFSPITVRVIKKDNEVQLSVHNEGDPIDPDAVPKLFEVLFQGASQSPDYAHPTSLGLGLYIAKEIIVAHGGRIDVQSSAHEGTTFIARIPAIP